LFARNSSVELSVVPRKLLVVVPAFPPNTQLLAPAPPPLAEIWMVLPLGFRVMLVPAERMTLSVKPFSDLTTCPVATLAAVITPSWILPTPTELGDTPPADWA
jgi:hypothetical protein